MMLRLENALLYQHLGAESIIGDEAKKQKSEQREVKYGGDKQIMLFLGLEQDPIYIKKGIQQIESQL